MTNPTAQTPEGWHIGAGFAEFLHGVGHGDLDMCECGRAHVYLNYGKCDLCVHEPEDESSVCQHGRDDYCRPCLVRERAEKRELGL